MTSPLQLDRLKFLYEQKLRDKNDKDKFFTGILLVFFGAIISVAMVFRDSVWAVSALVVGWIFCVLLMVFLYTKKEKPEIQELNNILKAIYFTYDGLEKQNKDLIPKRS